MRRRPPPPVRVPILWPPADAARRAVRSGVRPFGVSLLAAGYDDDGPHLYQIDPSGSFWAWKASAIGKNMVNAKTFLEKRYNEDIEIEDAIHTAILTLKVTPHAPRTDSCGRKTTAKQFLSARRDSRAR